MVPPTVYVLVSDDPKSGRLDHERLMTSKNDNDEHLVS